MVDHQFSDAGLAELYDVFHPWEQRGDFGFYLPLVMSVDADASPEIITIARPC